MRLSSFFSRFRLNRRQTILIILWLALTLQLLTLKELEANSPFFYNFPFDVDQQYYIQDALDFQEGRWPAGTAFDLSPLYSFYLGFIFKFLGNSIVLPRIFQAFEGVLACALLYKLGSKVFNPRIGLWATVLLATYAPFIYYNLELLTAAHSSLLIVLALWLAMLYARKTRSIYLYGIGLALGLAALGQPQNFILLAGIGWWFLCLKQPPARRILSVFIIFAVAGAVTAFPTWHNYQITGRFQFITTTGDMNLYIGNNPQATGVFIPVPLELQADIQAHQTSYPAETLKFIKDKPLAWLGLLGRKLVFFLVGSDAELGSNENFHFWGALYSVVLRLLPLRYELISLLSLIGLRFVWQRKSALLYGCYGLYAISTVLFFVEARFRMPFTPILILLSTAAGFEFYRRYRQGDKAILLLVFGLLLAMAALLIRYYYLLSGNLTIVS